MPRPSEKPPTSAPVADRVQAVLRSKHLTLYRISQRSAALYGRSSPYFVPHNLYYDLRSAKFSPSIHQIITLSRLSGYCLQDWLLIFGFNLEDITRFQICQPVKRTILIDTSLADQNEYIRWARSRGSAETIPAIAPLAQLLELTRPRRIGTLWKEDSNFLYAKIGYEDAIAFPEFVPGSIVRVNPDVGAELSNSNSTISDRFFLIEHSKGFSCCRIRRLENEIIVPVDNGLSYAEIELRVPQEAQLRGYVDLEFRPLLAVEEPHVPRDLARRWRPQPLRVERNIWQLLKDARCRLHLSTREASGMSRRIAEFEKDHRYESSSSSMSDYELHNPPRDLHKIFTLCSIYGLQFRSVMKAIGVELAEAGREPMPDRYMFRSEPSLPTELFDNHTDGGVLARLLDACESEVPFFLRDVPEYFSELRHISIKDFFWIGGDDHPLHPHLVNGLIAIVNRRRKTPIHFTSKPLWQQPIYILLAHDGKYRAACCGIENDRLVIHSYGHDFHRNAEYRYHQDIEVVGEIAAIARRIP